MAKLHLMTRTAATTETAFDDFIRFSRAKNLSEETIINYQRQFRTFNNFFEGDLLDITEDTIVEYIEHLQDKELAPTSINTALRHLRAIFNYWADKLYIQPVKVTMLKVNEQIKDTYTDEEIAKLLKRPDLKRTSFREYRTWAIINFFVGTGCRMSTMLNVRIGDIDWDNELIAYQHTKNKKAQFVPLSRQLAVVLREYLKHRQGVPEELLFPSETNKMLLRSSVAHDIANYNHKRGIEKTSAHLFRHTFAKNWILSGGDPLRLQKVLGHQSLVMAQHYANLYKQDLKRSFDDFNLLNKFTTERIKMGD